MAEASGSIQASREIAVKILKSKYFFVLPLIFLYLSLAIYPFLYMIYISFFNYSLGGAIKPEFIGIANYQNMLTDYIVKDSIKFTAFIVILGVTIETLLGLGIALLILGAKGEKFFRAITIVPMTLPMVVSGMVWKMLFNTQFGPINYFLYLLGLGKPSWLGDPHLAPIAVLLVDIWQWTPFIFLILYAGLKTVPSDLIEAATIDGASGWQVNRYVRIPMVKSLIIIALMLRLIELLKLFDIVYMITGGGPGTITYSYSYLIYVVGFLTGINLGYASALSIILLIFIIILTAILIKILNVKRLLGLG
jgi:multiple sugar transport system permease protein